MGLGVVCTRCCNLSSGSTSNPNITSTLYIEEDEAEESESDAENLEREVDEIMQEVLGVMLRM